MEKKSVFYVVEMIFVGIYGKKEENVRTLKEAYVNLEWVEQLCLNKLGEASISKRSLYSS